MITLLSLLAVPAVAAPSAPHLFVSNIVLGETARFEVQGAISNEWVAVLWSDTLGAGPCPGGSCLNIVRPRVLFARVATSQGASGFSGTVPASLGASEVHFQVVGRMSGTTWVGPVVSRTVQPDPPRPVDICPTPVPTDGFVQNGVTVEGDTLFVDMSYSGGCAVHDVSVCWDGAYALSLPVQVWLDVVHDGMGDPCLAWITETRRFDLGPVRSGYSWGRHDTIVAHVGADTVWYTF